MAVELELAARDTFVPAVCQHRGGVTRVVLDS